MFIPRKCTKRKSDTVQNTTFLSAIDVYKWQVNLAKSLYVKKKELFHKLTPIRRLNNALLLEYGIYTLSWKFHSKTTLGSINDYNRTLDRQFFLKDVIGKSDHYTAQLYKSVTIADSNRIVIYIDDLIAGEKNKYIDISDFNLYHLLMARTSITDIFSINSNGSNDPKAIIKALNEKFEELENAHLITYVKILN